MTLQGKIQGISEKCPSNKRFGNSLVVQRLGLHASTAGDKGSIPGGELRSHKPRGTVKNKNKQKRSRKSANQNGIKAESMLCWSEGNNLVPGEENRVGRSYNGIFALL